jgi:hypothetical protein
MERRDLFKSVYTQMSMRERMLYGLYYLDLRRATRRRGMYADNVGYYHAKSQYLKFVEQMNYKYCEA